MTKMLLHETEDNHRHRIIIMVLIPDPTTAHACIHTHVQYHTCTSVTNTVIEQHSWVDKIVRSTTNFFVYRLLQTPKTQGQNKP